MPAQEWEDQPSVKIEKFNTISVIFIGMTCLMAFMTILMRIMESKLPAAVKHFFRYGKLSHGDKKNYFISLLEVPKGWFSHFYIFALIWSWWSMYLVVQVSCLHKDLPRYAAILLDYFSGGNVNNKVLMDSTTAFIAMALMCLQCSRRFYESNFVQIFSKKNKMSIVHYILSYMHYFFTLLALLVNVEGTVKGSTPSPINFYQISFTQYCAVAIFLFSWWHQYQSNLILVNLRKDAKTGNIVSEKHLLPKGGFFDWVSSPHMFFEIMMYVAVGLLTKCTTWWFVVLWVTSNQLYNGIYTHRWYKETFPNYPKNRAAIIPFIL